MEYLEHKSENFTTIMHKSGIRIGEIVECGDFVVATNYRSEIERFNFQSLAIGWIIASTKNAKKRKSSSTEQLCLTL